LKENILDNDQFNLNCQAYLEHIKNDYLDWSRLGGGDPAIRQEMAKEFCVSVHMVRGTKYIKVVSGRSVHSFIVIKPDAKFKFGDILKAASWKAPATNFARGNILLGDFSSVTWTGAA
jgi:hypothetical protein